MSKKHKNILWLFVLAFFVAESLLIFVTTSNYRVKRNRILEDRTNQLKISYESISNSLKLLSNVIYEQVINTPQITELYSRAYTSNKERQAEIRDSLIQILNPTYSELSAQSIRQLHFYLPDNTCFLHFQSSEKFGDNLANYRESVSLANEEERIEYCFEGSREVSVFHFVYPLSYEGKLIGTVEISVSFDGILQLLHKQTNNVYSFVLKKSAIDDKVIEEEKPNYAGSDISNKWMVDLRLLQAKDSIKTFSGEILKNLEKAIKKKNLNQLDEGQPFSVFIDFNKNKYTVSFVPIFNIKQEHVAYLMSYLHDADSHQDVNGIIISLIGGSILILIIAVLFFVIYTKNITIEDQHSILEETETRYQQIYNTIEIGILTTTIDGKIILANHKSLELLGYESLKEMQEHTIYEFYIDQEKRKGIIDKLISDNTNQINGEILWKKKDESTLLIKFLSKIHKDRKGNSYIESVIQDVTDIRLLEESLKTSESYLRESNAAKDRFFSILAHDLRGPFSSLLGLTEILALNPETVEGERKTRFIRLIYSNVKNLSNLIENLLEWSRTQQGTINYEPKEINLEYIVKETINLLSEMAFAKQIIIMADINASISLLADENMTKTTIRNLISNAIKFTHKEGLIKVYTGRKIIEESKRLIEIVVEDNGVGIEQNDLDKLFKIDSGYTNPGTEDEKGTGLGLVLIKEFVEKHGGIILIESEKGIGTKATVTLPIRP